MTSKKEDLMLCTSILIQVFHGNKEVINKVYEYQKKYNLHISPLVYYEFFRGAFNNDIIINKKMLQMSQVLTKLNIKDKNIIPLDRECAYSCCLLYDEMIKNKDNTPLNHPMDFIIGASSCHINSFFWSLNKKHIETIPRIKLIQKEEDIFTTNITNFMNLI